MTLLIGLSGYARSGKDTVADILVAEHGFKRVAFADKLKAVAYDLNPFIAGGGGGMRRLQAEVNDFGWDKAKERPEVRRILQALGASVRDHVHDATWVNAALGSGPYPGQPVVVSDVRYLNEVDAVRFRHGSIIRINRPGVEAANDHPSERLMEDQSLWDGYINNDGSIEDLGHMVHGLVTALQQRVREAV